MTMGSFDFRKPPPGEHERQLGQWLALTVRQAAGVWTRLIPFPIELKVGSIAGTTAGRALAAFPEDTIGLPFTTTDTADSTILLALPRPLLLALLAGLMGETPRALPADRDLTDLESSLISYLTREFFLNPLEKGWPGADPLAFQAGAPGAPRAIWRIPAGESVLVAALPISTPFGEHAAHLLVPRVGRWDKLATLDPRGQRVPAAPREQLEALVREMAVDLDVVLGTADLTMNELAHLKAGDLVVLRQKVTQPLDGLISGARKFLVWPGVVGSRAAVLIDAPADD